MLLQGMEGGWVVIEASHTVRSGLNVTCHMLIIINILTRTCQHVLCGQRHLAMLHVVP